MMYLMLLELQRKKGTSGGQACPRVDAVDLLSFPGTGTSPRMLASRLQ